MSKFIGYTVGLECWINGSIKMVKCEYSRIDGGVMIRAVSGNNLGRFGGGHSKNISQETYEARPIDCYNDTIEAIWALKQIGLSPAAIGNDGDI
jgi:hypothetical protein